MSRPRSKKHNTHILIPEELWSRITARAKALRITNTDVICKALKSYFKIK